MTPELAKELTTLLHTLNVFLPVCGTSGALALLALAASPLLLRRR